MRTSHAWPVALLFFLATATHGGDLQTLAGWMTGSFGSEAQAGTDEAYFDIRTEEGPYVFLRKTP